MTGIDRVARFVWADVPGRIGRSSRTLGVALADGAYLAAWPTVGALVPVTGFTLGALVAVTQGGVTIAYSLLGLIILTAVAGLAGGAGTWLLFGYVVLDIISGNALADASRPSALTVVRAIGAAMISYGVVAILAVLLPVTVLAFREELVRLLRVEVVWLRPTVHAVLAGALVWAWAQAAAFLLRPAWTFQGRTPDVAPISNLQADTWILVLVGTAAATSRALLETRALPRLPRWAQEPAVDLSMPPRRLPHRVAVPLRAAVLVVLLSGLVASALQAFGLFIVLLVPLAAQAVGGRVRPIAALAAKVPLVVRVAVVVAAAYMVGKVVVEPQVHATSSFVPMLVAVTLSLCVAAVLLPQQEP